MKDIQEWAEMGDTEFYFRYLRDAGVEELTEFLETFPQFLEDDCQFLQNGI